MTARPATTPSPPGVARGRTSTRSTRSRTTGSSVRTRCSPARSVYWALAFYADGEKRDRAFPKIKTICSITRLGESTVVRALQELVNAGLALKSQPQRYEHGGLKPFVY